MTTTHLDNFTVQYTSPEPQNQYIALYPSKTIPQNYIPHSYYKKLKNNITTTHSGNINFLHMNPNQYLPTLSHALQLNITNQVVRINQFRYSNSLYSILQKGIRSPFPLNNIMPAVFFFETLQLIVCYSWIIFRDKRMEVLVDSCAGY